MSDNPKIYVADLEAYNNGELKGSWLDLTDYSDGSEVLEAIEEIVGENEYAIHDYENFPSAMYSEYMGETEFDEVLDLIKVSDDTGLPIEVINQWVDETGGDVEDVESAYYGEYQDREDFAYQLVDEGVLTPDSNNVFISNTDRRIVAGEEADFRVDDIYDVKELVEEHGDMDAYEEAEAEDDEDRMEEIVDEAKEKLRDEIYDEWYDGLEDPINFLVYEQGLYSEEDALKQSFIQVDYEKLADELEYDFTFIDGDGLYVFTNNYAKGGKVRSKRSIKTDRARLSKEPWEQAYKSKRKGSYYEEGGEVDIDGNRYEIIEDDFSDFKVGELGYNPQSGYVMVVDEEDLEIANEEWRKVKKYAKGGKTWVQDVTNSPNFKEGSFSAKAEKRGMSSKAFMKQVLHSPSDYDETTRRQAQFMKNAFKFELGGEVERNDEAIEFIIPSHYASAIINGDTSGLDSDDESELNSFINDIVDEYGNAMFMLGDKSNETYFSPYNDINNFGSDVMVLYLIPSNQTKQYAVGGEVIYTDLTDNTQSRKIWESRKSKNTGQNSFGSFAHRLNGKYLGDYYLYRLDDFDENYYKHIKLKDGEILARVETDKMVGGEMPLVKLNLKKGFVHFMTDSEDDKNPKFDRSSAKVVYLSLDKAIQNYAKTKGTKWS